MNSDFIVAVHALVYLNHKADIVSSEALAKNICTNAARVRKVMAPLTRRVRDHARRQRGRLPFCRGRFGGRPAHGGRCAQHQICAIRLA